MWMLEPDQKAAGKWLCFNGRAGNKSLDEELRSFYHRESGDEVLLRHKRNGSHFEVTLFECQCGVEIADTQKRKYASILTWGRKECTRYRLRAGLFVSRERSLNCPPE